ncbi:DoxX family protein [Mucilaginibacter ginkgonis]|uniref:DoxX family protein n=1 Tax=Mucilaginibacter ginkgonis TaxID=2682091 RepID=A0A6I4I2Y7_9SPHI|nr:DoxX family protein [Mucilaginibacter ginkgonis]QQL49656.1 DoxX family protein [Mucilaginibacter ginkgonis]
MNLKTKKITGWVLTAIISFMLTASASDKIIGSEHALVMTKSFGISAETYRILGLIEISSVILFAIPRTGILGTLLLSSYLGGAIATHLQHQQNILFPMAIEAVIWIAAVIRFDELSQRLLARKF